MTFLWCVSFFSALSSENLCALETVGTGLICGQVQFKIDIQSVPA